MNVRFTLLLSLVVTACECTVPGGVRVSVERDGGRVVTTELDFGSLQVGASREAVIYFENTGLGAVNLEGFDVMGSAIQVGDSVVDEPVFELGALPSLLAPQETVSVHARFTARVARSEGAEISARYGNAPDAGNAVLRMIGRGERSACKTPSVIDFGALEPGQRIERTIELENETDGIVQMSVTGLDSAPFAALGPTTATIGPRGTWRLPLRFAPGHEDAFVLPVLFTTNSSCIPVPTRLVGSAADITVTAVERLDFGFTAPGGRIERTLELVNGSLLPVQLNVQRFGAFELFVTNVSVPAARIDPRTNRLTAGVASVTMGFAPTGIGRENGQFVATTGRGTLIVQLTGFGGGPVFEAQNIDLGDVETGASSPTRFLVIRNVGTNSTPPDAAANLHFTDLGGTTFWSVNGTQELCVGVGRPGACQHTTASYDDTVGIAPGQALFIPVQVSPQAPGGRRTWEVRFQTNESARSGAAIAHITAQVLVVPPCVLAPGQTTLLFGFANQPTAPERIWRICNGAPPTDPNPCRLRDVTLTGQYAFVGQPDSTSTLAIDQLIGPQECTTIPLRALPTRSTTNATIRGRAFARFANASSSVSLESTEGSSCLLFDAAPLDFGPTPVGCSPARRTVFVHNVCAGRVSFSGPTMLDSAEGAFTLESSLLTSTTIQRGSSVAFSVTFSPWADGEVTGALSITELSGIRHQRLLTLKGDGLIGPRVTQHAALGFPPQVDVGLLVDGTTAFRSEYPRLADALPALFEEALDAGVDVRVSMLTPDVRTSCPRCSAGRTLQVFGTKSFSAGEPDAGSYVNAMLSSVFAIPAATSVDLPQAFLATTYSEHNLGVFRKDVPLGLVVLGTESTSGVLFGYERPALQQAKGSNRPGTVSVNRIVSAPCNLSGGDTLVNVFAGVRTESCSRGWTEAMRAVSRRATGFRDRVFLNGTPARTPNFLVRKNGGIASGWSYEQATNSLRFNDPSGEVDVSYDLRCE